MILAVYQDAFRHKLMYCLQNKVGLLCKNLVVLGLLYRLPSAKVPLYLTNGASGRCHTPNRDCVLTSQSNKLIPQLACQLHHINNLVPTKYAETSVLMRTNPLLGDRQHHCWLSLLCVNRPMLAKYAQTSTMTHISRLHGVWTDTWMRKMKKIPLHR